MACNIDKIVKKLEGNKDTKAAVTKILHKDKGINKRFDNLVRPIIGEHKLTTYKRYLQSFSEILFSNVDSKIKTLEFEKMQIRYAAQVEADKIVGGAYDPDGNIFISRAPRKKSSSEAIRGATEEGILDDLLNNVVEKDLNTMSLMFGPNIVLHELVHANTSKFLEDKANRNSPVTKKLEALFKEATAVIGEHEISSSLWTKNVEEFIAEAMSNPMLMNRLNEIPTKGTYKKLNTVFKELYYTLIEMLGFNKKDTDTLYTEMLDVQLAIMQEYKDNNANKVTGIDALTSGIDTSFYSTKGMSKVDAILEEAKRCKD